MRLTCLVVGMLAATSAMAADGGPVAFRADARVELDANGKATKIEVPKDLPEAIRAFIEKRIGSYTFSPPERDGVRGPAVTFLQLGACAIPTPEGYRLGLDLKGNGPRVDRPDGRLLVMPYPREAQMLRSEVSMTIVFYIEPDGTASLDTVRYSDGKSHVRDGFAALARNWVELIRFEPEQLAGQPLRSQAEITFNYTIPTGRSRAFSRTSEIAKPDPQQIRQSTECKMAAGEASEPEVIAGDSPTRVLTSG
jgi:hypothetical protein